MARFGREIEASHSGFTLQDTFVAREAKPGQATLDKFAPEKSLIAKGKDSAMGSHPSPTARGLVSIYTLDHEFFSIFKF